MFCEIMIFFKNPDVFNQWLREVRRKIFNSKIVERYCSKQFPLVPEVFISFGILDIYRSI